jgi:hypothetical protein
MGNEVANGIRGFIRELIHRVESDGAWWGEEARASVRRRERSRWRMR